MIRKRPLILVVLFALAACGGEKKRPPEEKVPVTVAVAETKDVPVEVRAATPAGKSERQTVQPA